MSAQGAKLYPDCGCPPDRHTHDAVVFGIVNVVCRNPECIDYGTHRRGLDDDHCQWCGDKYTLLANDPFKGAR